MNQNYQIALLNAASKSGDVGTMELAAQLVDAGPCQKCGYVWNHCQCNQVRASKSEGVQDIVKWMEAELKKQQVLVEGERKRWLSNQMYDEYGSAYQASYYRAQTKLETMVEWKISTEKYMKKLRHQGE